MSVCEQVEAADSTRGSSYNTKFPILLLLCTFIICCYTKESIMIAVVVSLVTDSLHCVLFANDHIISTVAETVTSDTTITTTMDLDRIEYSHSKSKYREIVLLCAASKSHRQYKGWVREREYGQTC